MLELPLQNKILRSSVLGIKEYSNTYGGAFLYEVSPRDYINSVWVEDISYIPLRPADRDIVWDFLNTVGCFEFFERKICLFEEIPEVFQARRIPNSLSETLVTHQRSVIKFKIIEFIGGTITQLDQGINPPTFTEIAEIT